MIAEINAAIQSVKALNDLMKATREVRNANEFAIAINDVNTKLTQMISVAAEAREKQLTLSNRINELEKEINELKDWQREAECYELTEIAPGTLTYCPKPAMKTNEPVHALCTNCFDQSQKSILQRPRNAFVLHCPRCKTEFHLNEPLGFRPMQRRMIGENS